MPKNKGAALKPHLKWAVIIAALIWHNTHTDHPLSATVRRIYKPHTRVGAAMLVASWGALTAWVLPHWVRRAEDKTRRLA